MIRSTVNTKSLKKEEPNEPHSNLLSTSLTQPNESNGIRPSSSPILSNELNDVPTDLENYSRILLHELKKKETLIQELQSKLNEAQIQPSSSSSPATSTNAPISGLNALKQTKWIQLMKKNRALQVQLNKTQTQNQSLKDQLLKTTQALEQLSLTPSTSTPTSSSSQATLLSTKDSELKKYKDQVHQLSQQLNVERSNQSVLKQALTKWQSIVEKETGEPITKFLRPSSSSPTSSSSSSSSSSFSGLEKLAPSIPSGWRGRAQLITILKAKLTKLEAKVPPSSPSSFNAHPMPSKMDESIRLAQEKRRAQYDHLQHEHQTLQTQLEHLKTKLVGLQARNRFLSQQELNLKDKLQFVLTKSSKDDQLIQLLQKELNYWKTSAVPPSTSSSSSSSFSSSTPSSPSSTRFHTSHLNPSSSSPLPSRGQGSTPLHSQRKSPPSPSLSNEQNPIPSSSTTQSSDLEIIKKVPHRHPNATTISSSKSSSSTPSSNFKPPNTLLISEREKYELELQKLRTKLKVHQNEIQVLQQTLDSVQQTKYQEYLQFLKLAHPVKENHSTYHQAQHVGV